MILESGRPVLSEQERDVLWRTVGNLREARVLERLEYEGRKLYPDAPDPRADPDPDPEPSPEARRYLHGYGLTMPGQQGGSAGWDRLLDGPADEIMALGVLQGRRCALMETSRDEECRQWSTGRCGLQLVILPGSSDAAFAMVHEHRGMGTGPDGASVVGRFAYCFSRNRRASSTAVHEVLITPAPAGSGLLMAADRGSCGVLTGELRDEVGEDEHVCWGCLSGQGPDAFRPVPRERDVSWDQRNAELLALGQVKAHICYREDGKADVALNVPAELLVSLIKDVPGRVYEPPRRAWVIPAVWAPDLAASLANAGVDVRETPSAVASQA